MNVGASVFSKNRNWPQDVQQTRINPDTGEAQDIAGQGFYDGRGKIIGMAGDNNTVWEEESSRLVELGPDHEDVIVAHRVTRKEAYQ